MQSSFFHKTQIWKKDEKFKNPYISFEKFLKKLKILCSVGSFYLEEGLVANDFICMIKSQNGKNICNEKGQKLLEKMKNVSENYHRGIFASKYEKFFI